ncbi:hypothetical protein CATYP_02505 [Corynebacterium atypicum]|uniref:Uncharacterized protein n=1 Tax=Corynebacterium atypicum TaxID=191610 RepID=A0ABN4DBL0_9CORY|nr:hypothetical protein CATYP_02505 [Corynebacterium atypicum]
MASMTRMRWRLEISVCRGRGLLYRRLELRSAFRVTGGRLPFDVLASQPTAALVTDPTNRINDGIGPLGVARRV